MAASKATGAEVLTYQRRKAPATSAMVAEGSEAAVGATLRLLDAIAPFLTEDERATVALHRASILLNRTVQKAPDGTLMPTSGDGHPMALPLFMIVRRALLDRQPNVANDAVGVLRPKHIGEAYDRVVYRGYLGITVRTQCTMVAYGLPEPYPVLRGAPIAPVGDDAPPAGYRALRRFFTPLPDDGALVDRRFRIRVTSCRPFDVMKVRLVVGLIRGATMLSALAAATVQADGRYEAEVNAAAEVWRVGFAHYNLQFAFYRSDEVAESADDNEFFVHPLEVSVERDLFLSVPSVMDRLVAGGIASPIDADVWEDLAIDSMDRIVWRPRHPEQPVRRRYWVLYPFDTEPFSRLVRPHLAFGRFVTNLDWLLLRMAFPDHLSVPPSPPLWLEDESAEGVLSRLYFRRRADADREDEVRMAELDVRDREALQAVLIERSCADDPALLRLIAAAAAPAKCPRAGSSNDAIAALREESSV